MADMDFKKPILKIELCRPEAKIPRYMNLGDAGMDLYAAEEVFLAPGETKAVALGFKAVIPLGYEVQIRPRSGISFKTRLRLPNSIGTIDAGYRDEWRVLLHNSSVKGEADLATDVLTLAETKNRAGTYQIKVGDRIAQMVVKEVCQASFELVEDVSLIGENRGGGFGSSGIC